MEKYKRLVLSSSRTPFRSTTRVRVKKKVRLISKACTDTTTVLAVVSHLRLCPRRWLTTRVLQTPLRDTRPTQPLCPLRASSPPPPPQFQARPRPLSRSPSRPQPTPRPPSRPCCPPSKSPPAATPSNSSNSGATNTNAGSPSPSTGPSSSAPHPRPRAPDRAAAPPPPRRRRAATFTSSSGTRTRTRLSFCRAPRGSSPRRSPTGEGRT